MQFLKNPFYLYVISFFSIILIYNIGWSSLYPDLSLSLLIFFAVSFLVSISLGGIIDKYNPIKYIPPKKNNSVKPTIIIISILYAIELIYNKGIPVIQVLTKSNYQYTEFGIPTLHPLLTTFTSFFAVYIFHLSYTHKFKKHLINLFILTSIPIIIYNRGMLLIMLTSFLFIYLSSIKRIRLKTATLLLVLSFFILYGFGVLGNYRMAKSASNTVFLEASHATKSFRESKIPKEYMWSYIQYSRRCDTITYK